MNSHFTGLKIKHTALVHEPYINTYRQTGHDMKITLNCGKITYFQKHVRLT